MDESSFDHSTFSRNRARLLQHAAAGEFLRAIARANERLPGRRRIALGADKGYDTRDFIAACRALDITPHIAQNHARPGGSALDARTVRHPGYANGFASGWRRRLAG